MVKTFLRFPTVGEKIAGATRELGLPPSCIWTPSSWSPHPRSCRPPPTSPPPPPWSTPKSSWDWCKGGRYRQRLPDSRQTSSLQQVYNPHHLCWTPWINCKNERRKNSEALPVFEEKLDVKKPEALPIGRLLLFPLHHLGQTCSKLRPLHLHGDDSDDRDGDDEINDVDEVKKVKMIKPFHSHLDQVHW